jgi:hypothetical protein
MAEYINFVELVDEPLYRLEALLEAIRRLLGEAANEEENNIFNLILMAQEQQQRIRGQLDKDIESNLTAEKTFECLAANAH